MGKSVHVLAVTLLCAGCGSGLDSSLVAFEDSRCKSGHGEEDAAQARPRNAYAEYDGLQCFVWERLENDVLAITLTNFHAGCAVTWGGDAVLDGDTVELRLTNLICAVAGCGWCIYDWSFEVSDVPEVDELPVRVARRGCPDESFEVTDGATLPLGEAAAGALCRYGNKYAVEQHAGEMGQCGQRFMPCTSANEEEGFCWSEESSPPCTGDLVCEPETNLCHQQCTSNDDCPLPGTVSCQDGLCRPVDPW